MKFEREGKPTIIVGRRVVLAQIVGAACAWAFWLLEVFAHVDIPAAMVTEAVVLITGAAQIYAVNKWGVTTV